METFRRNVSTQRASRVVIAIWGALAITLVFACGDGTESDAPTVVPTGSDGAPLTTITFVTKEGEEVDLLVEVANTPEERSRGLMFRESLAQDQGMLFVFEQEAQGSFWMKDTQVPLSIAFIEGEGEIVEIQDMEPLSEELHTPAEPYLYAVEANQGWFAGNGIGVGAGVRIARVDPTDSPAPAPSP